MADEDWEDLIAGVVLAYRNAPQGSKLAAGKRFLFETRRSNPSETGKCFAIVELLDALDEEVNERNVNQLFLLGCNFMSIDKSVNASGNSSLAGVNTGDHSNQAVHDISIYNARLDQSKHLNPTLRTLLKEARQAIESGGFSSVEKQDAIEGIGKLTEELEKESPEPSRVKRLWDGLSWAATKALPLANLANELATIYNTLSGDSSSVNPG